MKRLTVQLYVLVNEISLYLYGTEQDFLKVYMIQSKNNQNNK